VIFDEVRIEIRVNMWSVDPYGPKYRTVLLKTFSLDLSYQI